MAVASCPALEVDMTDRVLWFPDDVSVGFLEAIVGEVAVVSAPARGHVRVPAGAWVHLWVKCPVRGLAQLRPDDVTSIKLEKKTATDEDFVRLGHLTGLRELNASKSHQVGDAGLAGIASLRRLRHLDVYSSQVTDAGLAHLSGMVELEYLHLGNTRVSGPGLAHLVGLQRLTYLKLEETEVGDESVPHLLRLRALQRLVLQGTRMTVRGLARLRAGLPELRDLYMRQPGRRVAVERARHAVLEILARRLRPGRNQVGSAEAELREMLPKGSRIAAIRTDGGAPRAIDWSLDDLDLSAAVLPRLGAGLDLRIVTPAGMDVWVPWLRPRRRTDRRRLRSGPVGPRATAH
ncbi:MAG TPA: hypothetical protein VGQ33_05555 [Vicinamibacteria bacterium]|nr:hypothetical protein [Vicinamibacteria bacterium]